MSVTISTTNKPLNPRAQDLSPKGYNRASLYSGKALDFDGVNDQVNVTTIGSVFNYGNAYTMAGYFKIVGTASGSLMGNSNGNGFANFLGFVYKSGADSNFYPNGNSSNYVTIYSGTTTDFVHIVCTSDGTTAKAYLNGQLVGSKNISSYSNTSSVFNVGSSVSGNFGDIEASGVRVFNTALTAAQVSDLYLNPEKIVPDGVADSALKLWLPMMEGAGTTAYDGSGNGNHGTINGATWTSGIGAPVAQTALVGWNKGTNYFEYSEDYSQAVWNRAALNIVGNAATSPDGYQNADKIYPNATGSISYLYNISSTTSSVHTISAYVKADGKNIVWLYIQGGLAYGTVYFDLSDQSIQVQAGSTSTPSGTITAVGNDWYRITMTTGSALAVTSGSGIGPSDAKGSTYITANGTDGILVWGMQLEQASSVGPYIPTLATAQASPVLLPQGLTANKDITGVNAVSRNAYALNLDGASWAEVHDNASVDLTEFTLEGWAYVDITESYRGALLAKYKFTQSARSYAIERNGVSIMLTVSSDGSATTTLSSGTISSTGWHHFVATYDSSFLKIYLDGVVNNYQSYTGAIYSQAYPLTIGVLDTASMATSIMNDQIALPRIYNRALTATEVARNYNADKSKFGL